MAFLVSDPNNQEVKTLRFNLRNKTDFEVTFRIGGNSYTLQPNQIKTVRAKAGASIEAQPGILGIERGFLVGGVKKDCSLSCYLESDESQAQILKLSTAE